MLHELLACETTRNFLNPFDLRKYQMIDSKVLEMAVIGWINNNNK